MRHRGIIIVSVELWRERKIRRAVKRAVNVLRIQPSMQINGEELLCESSKFDPVKEGERLPHYNLILKETKRAWRGDPIWWAKPRIKVAEIENLNIHDLPKIDPKVARRRMDRILEELRGTKPDSPLGNLLDQGREPR